jgi:hypothetical protein
MSRCGMDEGRERHGWHWGYWVALAATAYVLPFIAILFDLFVFETNVCMRFGPGFFEVIEIIYGPLIKLFGL